MANNALLDKLNDAIARELQVSVQYIWQHVMVRGLNAESVGGIFKKFAITEMKHAEAIAERLDYLGGVPTTKPTTITIGKNLKAMLMIDKKVEEEAITLYNQIISMADKAGDVVTRKLFEGILIDETEHHNSFSTLLED
ncbi:MAG: bacterioferritin [Dissulfurispiraceae bacterium]